MNLIFKDENAIFYEIGYSCDNAILICLSDEKILITDSRYKIEAEEKTKNIEIKISSNLIQTLIELLKKNSIKKIYFNPKEWTFFDINSLKNSNKIEYIPQNNLSLNRRIIKNDDEILKLKEAARLGEIGFNKFAKAINEVKNINRLTEKELAFINYSVMSDMGNLDISFKAIIAINENSAKPHAHPSLKTLSYNSLLLVDAGIKYKRYCSDRTRTAFVNKKINFEYHQLFSDKKRQNIYDTVLKAHDSVIKNARTGMKAKDLDKIARDVIHNAGYGEYFIHSTGHGVGLDIHELPFISSKSEDIMQDNMIFTVEPGIYIPNFMGVRIEDMVLFKNGRLEVL